MLDQPDGALHLQAHPEDPVDPGQHLERARTVEVQEVDVRHRALQHPLREGQHEAFLHRRPRRAVEAPQRHQHERTDGAQRQHARPLWSPRRPVAPRARWAEHEGRRVFDRGSAPQAPQVEHGALRQRGQADCGEDDEGDLRRSSKARRAVGVGRGDGDHHHLDEQWQHRDLASPQGDEASHCERHHGPVLHEPETVHPQRAPLDAGQLGVLQRTEDLPLPPDASCHHHRQPAEVVPGVVEADLLPVPSLLGLVARWIAALVADPLLAVEEPVAEELAVIRVVAVRVDLQLAGVG